MTATIEMPSGRVFHQIGREDRSCELHGDYESYQFEIRNADGSRRAKERFGAGVEPVDDLPVPLSSLPLPEWLCQHWTNCPTCNAEWEIEAEKVHREAVDGVTEKEAARRRKIESTGIPERFRDSTLWNWEDGMEKQARFKVWAKGFVHDFANDLTEGRSAVFLGTPGTGKTHLAIGLLQEVIKEADGRYTTVMDMLGRIKDTYNQQAHETEEEVIYEYSKVGLLVIDEVGKQLDTNYEQAQFFRIIDKRYRNKLSTILISNMGPAEVRDFLGEAVMDRLGESGGKILGFDWASYRRKVRRKKVVETT